MDFMKLLISIGFGSYVLIGNLCMMPMTQSFANDVPMAYAQVAPNASMHTEHREMEMTPVVPMTPVYCEYCEKALSPDPAPMKGGMPCGDGHCLMHARSNAFAAAPVSAASALMSLPTGTVVLPVAPLVLVGHPPATAPPPRSTYTDTIVLRC